MTAKLFTIAALLIIGGVALFVSFGGVAGPAETVNGHAIIYMDSRNAGFRVGGLIAVLAGIFALCMGVRQFVAER